MNWRELERINVNPFAAFAIILVAAFILMAINLPPAPPYVLGQSYLLQDQEDE